MIYRYGSRFKTDLSIHIKTDEKDKGLYSLRDIGLGGACVRAQGKQPQKGDLVYTIVSAQPPALSHEFLCKAEVVYVNDDDFGVMWMEHKDQAYEPLYQYIQYLNISDT